MTKTLLVVDDSATMRKVFELTLLGEEVTLVTHDGSDSLLARARDVRPSAAIVDVNLGSTTGYDVCRALKSDAVVGRIPVLLLFSEQNPVDEAKLKDCGAEGSLSKPFETQALIDRVKQLLSTSQSQLAAVQAPAPKPTATIGTAVIAPSPPAAPVVAPGGVVPPSAPSSVAKPAGVGVPAANPTPGAARPKATQMFAPNVVPPAASPPSPPSPPSVVAPPSPPAAPAPPAVVAPSPVAAPKPAVVAPPSAVVPPKTAAPAPSVAAEAPAAPAVRLPADLEAKVAALGLTPVQVEAVAALTREVVERVVWEVVPQLAESMIREELRRLTAS
ncbi:MAG: response regulator [Myxococcales bacterium]|nr:response regulator [Myxococcales bacterium]